MRYEMTLVECEKKKSKFPGTDNEGLGVFVDLEDGDIPLEKKTAFGKVFLRILRPVKKVR